MNIKYMHSFFWDRNSLETHKLNFTSLSFACGPRVEYLKSSPRLLNFSTDLVICKNFETESNKRFNNLYIQSNVLKVSSLLFLNPLTPKSDQHLISPYSINAESRTKVKGINPLTPRSDQGRISPYTINTISSMEVMRIK